MPPVDGAAGFGAGAACWASAPGANKRAANEAPLNRPKWVRDFEDIKNSSPAGPPLMGEIRLNNIDEGNFNHGFPNRHAH
jgi:hypothetical protein